MSFSRLSYFNRACVAQNMIHTMQRRFLHRATDFTYMSIWKKSGVDYMQSMGRFNDDKEWNAGHHMYQSLKLVEQTLRVMFAMKEKGFIPFLHAAPASSRVSMDFAKILYPSSEQKFSLIRQQPLSHRMSLKEAVSKIPLTEQHYDKSHLLSLSYAMTSGIKHLESAASWGFVNHFGNHQYFLKMEQFTHVLSESGISTTTKAYFKQQGGALIRKYNRLQVGDFLVIGIPPEKVARFVYDSKPYNVPTGEDALDVAIHPEKYVANLISHQTHMATLLICNETLDPASGICMVNANDPEESESFCTGMTFTPMREIALYNELVSSEATDFEKNEFEKREALNEDLQKLVIQFESAVKNRKEFVEETSIDDFYLDFPPQMI